MKFVLSTLLIACASISISSAAILVTMQEVGTTLVMTATGSYNFAGQTSQPDTGLGLPAAFRADSLTFGWETAATLLFTGTASGSISGNSQLVNVGTSSASIPFYVRHDGVTSSFFLKNTAPLSGTVNNTATFTGQSFQSLGLVNGQSITMNFAGGNSVTFSVIPEPSTALLGAFGSLALLRRRRR